MSMTDEEIDEAVRQYAEEMYAKGFVRCQCGNWVPAKLSNCPGCHTSLIKQHLSSIDECPMCGQKLSTATPE